MGVKLLAIYFVQRPS